MKIEKRKKSVIKFLFGFILGVIASFYISPDFKNFISEYFNLALYYLEN